MITDIKKQEKMIARNVKIISNYNYNQTFTNESNIGIK